MSNTTNNNFIISKLYKTEIFAKNLYKKYKTHFAFDEVKSIAEFCLVELANDKKIDKNDFFDCCLFKFTKWKILNEFRKTNYEKQKIKNLHRLKMAIKNHDNYDSFFCQEEIINLSKHLNLNQKTIFLLKHLDNKSNKDIAKKCNVTKSRISQILNKVYNKLKFLSKNNANLYEKQ